MLTIQNNGYEKLENSEVFLNIINPKTSQRNVPWT